MIIRFLISLLLLPSVVFGGQGMGPGPGVKAYSASQTITESQVFNISASIRTTDVVTLTTSHPAGSLVAIFSTRSCNAVPAGQITSVTDSRGNTWTLDKETASDNRWLSIVKSNITTTLQIGDTITFNHGSVSTDARGWIYDLTGVSALDICANAGTVSDTPSIPGTVNYTGLALGGLKSRVVTYSNSNWTLSSNVNNDGYYLYSFRTVLSSTGSKNPGGSLASSTNWGGIWCAYH